MVFVYHLVYQPAINNYYSTLFHLSKLILEMIYSTPQAKSAYY